VPASDDGELPGTYYINLFQPESQSRGSIESVAFHETYPGHHLQVALAQERSEAQVNDISRGGYLLRDCTGMPELILLATGSEVALAVKAADRLSASGVAVRVVSLPCVERFAKQDATYRDTVLPPTVRARVAIEMAQPDGWYRWVGLDGAVIGIETFGESAPAEALLQHFGFTVERVVETAGIIMHKG